MSEDPEFLSYYDLFPVRPAEGLPRSSPSAGPVPILYKCGYYDTLVFCPVCGAPLYEAVTEDGPGKICDSCGARFIPLSFASQSEPGSSTREELSRSISRARTIEKKYHGGGK